MRACQSDFFLNGPLDVSDVLRYSTPRVVVVLRRGGAARLVGGANALVAVTTSRFMGGTPTWCPVVRTTDR